MMSEIGGRRGAAIASGLTVVALVVLALGMALNATGLFEHERESAVRLAQAISILPQLCCLSAIWTIHRAFDALSRGGAIERIVAQLLVRIGACLLLVGILRVLAEPWLMRLMLGTRQWANFDIVAITLGVTGLFLVLLAWPMHCAARMRTELDGFL